MDATEDFRLLSRNFVCICLANFLYFGSFYLLLPTLPQYVAGLGGTAGQIGLVMGAMTLTSVIVRPYCAKLADDHGRKLLMLAGVACFAALFWGYELVATVSPLYLVRIAHGVAHGCYLAASYSYVADLAPAHRRGEVMGIYAASNVLSMAIFPAVGTTIIGYTGSFIILFNCSMVSGAIAFASIVFLGETKPSGQRPKPTSLAIIARQRPVILASLTLFACAAAYGAVNTFLPVYAPQRGLANFGVFFSVYAVSTLISRVLTGTLSDRIGRRRVIIPFLGLLVVAVFLLPLLDSMALLVLIGVLFGLGFGAVMPTLNALVVDDTLPKDRGSALAFFTSFMDIGITFGSVILGFVGEFWGYATMFSVGGLIVLGGFVMFVFGSGKKVAPGQPQS